MKADSSRHSVPRRLLLAAIAAGTLGLPVVSRSQPLPCSPDNYEPTQPPFPGCEWWYFNSSHIEWNAITFRSDERKTSAWEDLPFCGCQWYPHYVPCPSCPPLTTTVTLTDTLTWSVSSTTTTQDALALKSDLIVDMSYTYQLTEAEQAALTGTHTETTQYQFTRQAILCFTRYYRTVWWERVRKGERKRKWTYYWEEWCGGYSSGQFTHTFCESVVAQGEATWNTYPNYEWAPGEPPCGGVPIGDPDPWDGMREKPCCWPLCEIPRGMQPCCGCEAAP
jgi:hypothetical protein